MNTLYQQARLSRDRRFDGTFFVAVKTTGVFCRPICPAVPPKEKNVEYYSQAELAIQAGYRPCLRCRPESSPRSFAWKGVETSVERALKLLGQNPNLRLKQIAEKLGVSDRYLRKLFRDRVGMGPKRYQLFQQLLFAKQLLHQTGLTVEQVAVAAGFQSARRLQDNFRQYIQMSPTEIRGRKAPGQTLRLQLAFRPPYNWRQLREFLAVRAVDDMEWVTERSYARTFRYQEQRGYFHALYQEDDHSFAVDLELENLDSLRGVTGEIRRLLDLDTDGRLISECLLRAGVPEAQLLPGLRLPGVWDAFEAGCRAVLGQQVSVKAAVGQVSLLVKTLGEPCARGHLFPTAEAIVESDLEFLRVPGSRRETLRRFARHWLGHGEPEDSQELLKLKGIGPWTLNYMKLRGYSHPDIWLATDLVIKKQLARLGVNPGLAAPWRSYLTFQLWSLA